MIRVQVKPDGVLIKGHAGYAEAGKDIICASVSASVMTTLNAILAFDQSTIKYEVSEGLFIIDIIKEDETTRKLMDNLVEVLENIQMNYPKNIKVER